MSGFGSDSYGGAAFGGGSSSIELASAYAIDTNTVRVVLTASALAESGFGIGDALNPTTWQIQKAVAGAYVDLTVIAVRPIAVDTFDVRTLEDFGDVKTDHTVASTTLLSPSGVPIGPTTIMHFGGVLDVDFAVPVAATSGRRYPLRDIANPPFPNSFSISGGFVATAGGDVRFDEGVEMVRKLIYRRATTRKGAFFHLRDYGLDFNLKEPIQGTGDMVRLKKSAESQLAFEPEIEKVAVGLVQDPARDMLIVRIQARLKNTGQVINVESIIQG